MEQPQHVDHQAVVIQQRYHAEVEYIKRYVQLLRAKATIHDRQVADINRILRRVQLRTLPTRHYDRIGAPYSPEEIRVLSDAIRATDPEVYHTILGHEQRLDDIPSLGLDSPAAEYLDRLDEWVGYFMEHISDNPEEDVEGIVRNATREAEALDEDGENDRIPSDAQQALIALAADHALHAKVRERIDEMVYVRHQFDEIEVLARMATPNAEIDVLRQGFILLMTTFDAAVADLARFKFQQRFFEFIRVCGSNEKVTLQEIGVAGSFEAFRDQVIDEHVRRTYLKDLIGLIYKLGVMKSEHFARDEYVRLIEMMLRRNVHVHNRGMVDERYVELDPSSRKPKYNLHNLKVGDAAVIDDAYFTESLKRSARFVDALAVW